jgi:hypothetical protein
VSACESTWRAPGDVGLGVGKEWHRDQGTIARPVPTWLLAGWSPLASVMVASTETYAASGQKVIEMSYCASLFGAGGDRDGRFDPVPGGAFVGEQAGAREERFPLGSVWRGRAVPGSVWMTGGSTTIQLSVPGRLRRW